MVPYRANLGGAFGSGYFPAPVQRIDVGGAITAIGQQATTLLQSAYLRKVAEANNAARAKAEGMARMREERIDRENADFRARQLAIQERNAARLAAPKATLSADGTSFIVAPDMSAEVAPDAVVTPVAPDANGMAVPPMTPTPTAPTAPRLNTGPRVIAIPGATPRLTVPHGAQAVTPAQEAEGSAWYAQYKRDPAIVAAVSIVQRANPSLTEGQAAYLARETNQTLTPRPAANGGHGGQGGGQGGGRPPARPTGDQERSYAFWRRMSSAAPTIERLGPTARLDRVTAALAAEGPVAAAAVNRTLTADEQMLVTAVRQFAEPILRKNTGAAFGREEIQWVFQQVIPLSGDTRAAEAYKLGVRTMEVETMRTLATPAIQYYDAIKAGQPTVTNNPEDLDAILDAVLNPTARTP